MLMFRKVVPHLDNKNILLYFLLDLLWFQLIFNFQYIQHLFCYVLFRKFPSVNQLMSNTTLYWFEMLHVSYTKFSCLFLGLSFFSTDLGSLLVHHYHPTEVFSMIFSLIIILKYIPNCLINLLPFWIEISLSFHTLFNL